MIAKFKKMKRSESWQSIIFSVLFGVLILLIIGFLVASNFKINKKRAELNSQVEYLKTEIRALEEEQQQLQAKISQSSEEDHLEKEARESFNLKKPGEEVVTILPPEEKSSQEETNKEKQWWNLFGW